MALRHARDQQAKVLAICNTNGSTIPRESDAVLYTHAGPDIAVASTKAFLTQIVAAYLGSGAKPPWYIDLLNINLDNHDQGEARRRVRMFLEALVEDRTRITRNLDFIAERPARPDEGLTVLRSE